MSVLDQRCARWRGPVWIAVALAAVIACRPDQSSTPAHPARRRHPVEASRDAAEGGPPAPCSPGSQGVPDVTATEDNWVYGPFFQRIREQVKQRWNVDVMRENDYTPKQYGPAPRTTRVRVCLSRAGEFAGIAVTQSSGVAALDQEAIRSMRSAAPFLNPPDGLVHDDGLVRFEFWFRFSPTGMPKS